MSSNFEWQTDEERAWDKPLGEPTPVPSRRRRWPWATVLILVLLAGGAIVMQVRDRLDAASAAVRADLRATHAVREQAVSEVDAELFQSILSANNPEWAATQQILLDDGLLGADHPLALADGGSTVESVTVDAEMQSAELIVRQPLAGGGALLRTDVYRQGSDRWLYAPPEEAFWGDQLALQAARVTLIYPQRDAVFAERWLDQVARSLARACGLTSCGATNEMVITFSRDPLHVKLTSDVHNLWRSDRFVTLPAPSLFGLPADEAAYETLARYYGRLVVTAAISEWVAYECCDQELFFSALVDSQLADLRLGSLPAAAPAPPADRAAALLAHPDPLQALRDVWDAPRLNVQAQWLVPYLVAFLLEDNAANAADWQRQLATASDLDGWLASGPGASAGGLAVINGWLRAAAEVAQRDPLKAPAGAQIALLCESPTRQTLRFFDPATQAWREAATFSGPDETLVTLAALGDRSGVAISIVPTGLTSESWATMIHTTDGELVRFDDRVSRTPLVFTGRSDPAGRRLVMYSRDEDRGTFDFSLLDLDACAGGNCALQPAAGFPVWAPDGESTLIVTGSRLAVGDRFGQELPGPSVGRGFAPFWLNNEVYGFLRVFNVSNRDGVLTPVNGLSLRSVADRQATQSLTAADLLTVVPRAVAPDKLFIEYVMPHPADAGLLLVVATGPAREGFYLFAIEALEQLLTADPAAPPQIRFLTRLEKVPTEIFFAPAGHQVAVGAVETMEPSHASAVVIDLMTGELQTRPVYATAGVEDRHWMHWSADGQTLLITGEGYLHLWQPATGAEQRLYAGQDTCLSGAWVNAGLRAP